MKKQISRTFLFLLILACIFLSSCARIKPSELLAETTGGGDVKTEVWQYVPSDDAPVVSKKLKSQNLLYYDGGIYFSQTLMGLAKLYESEEPGMASAPSLRRLDVETGELTDVCPDPLCLHCTPSCPFGGMDNEFFLDNEGNLIYYRLFQLVGEKEYQHLQLCIYNLNTKEWRILFDETTLDTPSTMIMRFIRHNENLYYYKAEYDKQQTEEKTIKWNLIRQNIKTGKIEVAEQKDSGPYSDHCSFIMDDRIYFESTNEIYSTDLALTNRNSVYTGDGKIIEVQTDGQFIFMQILRMDSNENTIYRMDMDGGNLTDLGIATGNGQWRITQKYIYYTRPIPKILLWHPNSPNAFSVNLDAIMRCDRNGENHEEIFVFNHPEGEDAPQYQIFINLLPAGNYIYATEYGMIDKNKNGMCDTGEQYSYVSGINMRINRIDITTGEVTYIEPYKDFQ